jgi:hypothetical protein
MPSATGGDAPRQPRERRASRRTGSRGCANPLMTGTARRPRGAPTLSNGSWSEATCGAPSTRGKHQQAPAEWRGSPAGSGTAERPECVRTRRRRSSHTGTLAVVAPKHPCSPVPGRCSSSTRRISGVHDLQPQRRCARSRDGIGQRHRARKGVLSAGSNPGSRTRSVVARIAASPADGATD